MDQRSYLTMRNGRLTTDFFIFYEADDAVMVQAATGRALHLLNDAGFDLVDQTIAVLAEEPFENLMAHADALGLRTITFG